VFYDGDCVLCSRTVIFLLKVDKKKRLKFAPLAGTTSQSLSIHQALASEATVVYYKDGKLFYRSTAVLKITQQLAMPWPLFSIFLLIPAFIRDYIYCVIGKNRYKWFGKNETFFIKQHNHENRFLD
jgi:predicted DCC family thiol-disulfide oxidoreductase YuxK